MPKLAGRRIPLFGAAAFVAVAAVACSSGSVAEVNTGPSTNATPPPVQASTPTPEPERDDGPRIQLRPTPEGTIAEQIRDGWLQARVLEGWDTDITKFVPNLKVGLFTKPSDLINRDGIPSIDTPEFAPANAAPEYLRPEEPVIQVNINGDARAYPLSILMWHEIVNDVIGGEPVTVTFCPLCNSSIAFSGNHEGRVLDFGTTGWIASADLVMYDRQTQTWWQQITGEGVIGEFAGTRLTFLPSSIVGWQDFADQYPEGKVLLRPTPGTIHPVSGQEITHNRTYDDPPYSGYDVAGALPSFFTGAFDLTLQPIDRVAAFNLGGESIAYPFRALAVRPVVNDTVGGEEIVIFYDDGTESAFRTSTRGHDFQITGSTTVFFRDVAGQFLTFAVDQDGTITDDETGTTWNKFGRAIAGELAGTQLDAVVHGAEFWFAIATFRPDTEVRLQHLLSGD
ncbi:MAG: DUF3179 domain-containing protein [Chloroflexi bacterium]|nr:DUF3179 domain-containing protein [Chloroflexota bacterium]